MIIRQIAHELKKHAPYTALGALSGIVIMVLIVVLKAPARFSNVVFYTLHPLHVVLSALATTSMYKRYGKGKTWVAVLIGYTGSIGIATLSDAVIPFLGGWLLDVDIHFHAPFIETTRMPVIWIQKWIVVNSAAAIGIAIGFLRPKTTLPHAGHVLLSTWASLFNFLAFGAANWFPLLPFVFVFLFLAVWVPCCASDIIYPLIWAKKAPRETSGQTGDEHNKSLP